MLLNYEFSFSFVYSTMKTWLWWGWRDINGEINERKDWKKYLFDYKEEELDPLFTYKVDEKSKCEFFKDMDLKDMEKHVYIEEDYDDKEEEDDDNEVKEIFNDHHEINEEDVNF